MSCKPLNKNGNPSSGCANKRDGMMIPLSVFSKSHEAALIMGASDLDKHVGAFYTPQTPEGKPMLHDTSSKAVETIRGYPISSCVEACSGWTRARVGPAKAHLCAPDAWEDGAVIHACSARC